MIKKIFSVLALFALAISFVAIIPDAASAVGWNPFGSGVCRGEAQSSVACQDSRGTGANNPLTGTDGVIMSIVNLMSAIAGAAAVIFIILAALRFVTSGGSSEDITGARRTIIYAVVGLIIIALARTLVQFILQKV